MDDDPPPSGGGGLFIWTVIILLLVGVAMGCWIGSYYIFGHPEKPFSYAILLKLKKLETPKRFEIATSNRETIAPRGEFLRPTQIYERYAKMTPRELAAENEKLLRNYLRNFKLTQDLVPYVIGTYNVLDSYELTGADFIQSGVVALAQAKDNFGVVLEEIFPAEKKVIPQLQRTLLTGLDIDIKRENELAAILHVEKLDDGRIKVTAISILYPSYGSTVSSGTFTLEPPTNLKLEAGLPVTTNKCQRDADQKYKSYKSRTGNAGEAVASPAAATQNRLMRVERPLPVGSPAPTISPTPSPTAVPTPSPTAVPTAIPAASVSPTATPEPTPVKVTPHPIAVATPAKAAATPIPADAVTVEGSWPLYEPGQMPRGRLYGEKDMKDVESRGGLGGERGYLQGNFVVTASGPNKAVLRGQGPLSEMLGIGGKRDVRIIVEFPPGVKPPMEGTSMSRDARRPFQIIDVRKTEDGQVNVSAREITRP